MNDLTHAADHLDQLADALPDHLRLPRWHVDRDRIVTLDAAGDPDLIVADQHGIHDGEAVVRLLHALASPDRARALAALLRALDAGDGPIFGEDACDAMARDRLSYYGYTDEEVYLAAQAAEHGDECELTEHGWQCIDEDEKPLHPLQDAYAEACEVVRWVLDAVEERLRPTAQDLAAHYLGSQP